MEFTMYIYIYIYIILKEYFVGKKFLRSQTSFVCTQLNIFKFCQHLQFDLHTVKCFSVLPFIVCT